MNKIYFTRSINKIKIVLGSNRRMNTKREKKIFYYSKVTYKRLDKSNEQFHVCIFYKKKDKNRKNVC